MCAQGGGTKVDLVGVGLNATDTVIPVSAFPASGSKTEYSEHSVLLGGEISTAVIACRRWGLRTRYIGRLGDDYAARLHRAAFDDVGVETRIVTVDDASSPQSLILVDGLGERTVLCHRDPRLTMQPGDIGREWIGGLPRQRLISQLPRKITIASPCGACSWPVVGQWRYNSR